jgi:hypothetical protein
LTVAVDDAGKMVADDGTVSCLHGRGEATAVDDGHNRSGRWHQFIPFIYYSLATSFIVLYCQGRLGNLQTLPGTLYKVFQEVLSQLLPDS